MDIQQWKSPKRAFAQHSPCLSSSSLGNHVGGISLLFIGAWNLFVSHINIDMFAVQFKTNFPEIQLSNK